ncbi:MAG: TonB-dependent receptor [marine benthic group bacterium]|nr:TonB-dependent receptor [Gemmatimonadota bacterium]
MLRDLLRGALRSGLTAAGLAMFVASPLFAQTTGKVQGRVTDAATGAPVAGAQVRVVNTTLGNLTNDQGFYFINEVPAGLQNIEASFIGYRAVVVEGERILAGQTTTINFELEQTAVELEAITVEGERNPLVPRDQTATKAIVQGEAVDQLPLDNASSVVSFAPGVVQTNDGRSIRGGRPNEEAVLIDGVLTRQFGTGTANNVDVPTNALEQVDVTVGAFSAEFGEAQSGIVNYVTRTGGTRWTGSLEYQTDQLTPNDSWRRNFNRLEATLGGPLFGPLSFFLAGTLQGADRFLTENAPERYIVNGVEACPSGSQYSTLCTAGEAAEFQLNRGSAASGASDSLMLTAPNFTPWDNGRTDPTGNNQVGLFTGNLNLQLPRGSRINFAYTRNRTQGYGRDGSLNFNAIYNPDDISGNLTVEQIFSLSWFQTIIQSADQQLALDLKASYGTDRDQFGLVDYGWYQDNRDPFMGFSFSNVEYALQNYYGSDNPTITGFDWFDPSEEFIQAYRSNAVPRDSMLAFPQRTDIDFAQAVEGRSDNLRYNPYGFRTSFPVTGFDNDGWRKTGEDRLAFRGALDWQIGRFNRVKLGGEYTSVDLRTNNIPLYEGVPLPEKATPTRAGAFLQDRLDIGDLVLEGGIRWDYLDPDTQYPWTPAYVFNVPDSLKAGFVRYDEAAGEYVSLDACGPASADPSAPCVNNFVDGETKSEFSPRLGASFPVTPTSTFRLSYGRFVQTPAFYTQASFAAGDVGTSAGNIGFLQDTNTDLANTNTNATFGRDVDMPSTRIFEFGYRQLIGTGTVIDLSAFNKKQRSALASRKLPFEDPNREGATIFLNVVTNNDFTETNGFEVRLDQAISNLFTGNFSYTFLDARGTGSDPFTYENLILRATTNLETLTGVPSLPPEALLTLEQSRRHNLALTTSLNFPLDWQDGTVAGSIFQDFGLFTILTLRSGLPFTKLRNSGNGEIGPPSATFAGVPESSISGLETPWVWNFDLRATKGFQLGQNFNLQLFLDWRNPLNLKSSTQVFLETASTVNAQHRDEYLSSTLRDDRLDGDNIVRGFDIVAESPENDFNKYMLLRAEERWGNGDGFFSVEEQNRSFGELYEDNFGQDVRFETSDQMFRLGLRFAFF